MTIAPNGSVYPPNATRGDRNRRRRWLDKVHASPVSPGCKAWLGLLSTRSSDEAKPVWGRQTGQATAMKRSARTVRRWRAEAEQAGLIETQHGENVQDEQGRWRRTHTNLYRLCPPPPARKRSSYRPAKNGRENNTLKGVYETPCVNRPRIQPFAPRTDDPVPFSSAPPGGFEALRAALGR